MSTNTHAELRLSDVPPEERNAANVLLNSQLRTVLGERADSLRDVETYLLLATLSVHDLSALRELVGMPKRILCAARSADNTFLSVTFDYGSFVAYYEVSGDASS